MGEVTSIAWTHHTFNPWIGCTKVSPGCTNCYAAAQDHRWGHDRWGVGKKRERTSDANWRKPLAWERAAAKAGVRHRVFCASMADIMDPEVDYGWRYDLWNLIAKTPHLDWQILTKRPENLREGAPEHYLPYGWGRGWPNVWLGVTVEDQQRALERIPLILETPATVRFLSCEPLLGHLSLSSALPGWTSCESCGREHYPPYPLGHRLKGRFVQWVIVGGESGAGARPMQEAWARSIVEQCRQAHTPCFMKQMGRSYYLPDGGLVRPNDRKGDDISTFAPDLRIREFPEVRS